MFNIQKINYITFCYKPTKFNSFDIKSYIIYRKWLQRKNTTYYYKILHTNTEKNNTQNYGTQNLEKSISESKMNKIMSPPK